MSDFVAPPGKGQNIVPDAWWHAGFLTRLQHDRSGGIIVMFALLLPIMVGFVGLGVEVGLWFESKRDLQTAADAAAIGGAYEAQDSSATSSTILSVATTDAGRNGYDAATDTISTSNPPGSGSYTADGNAVEATITRSVNLLFSGYFMDSAVSISARAVATNSGGSADTCFVSLNTTDEQAFHLSNNVDLPSSCGVFANSSYCSSGSSGGIYLDNNSTIAGATQVVGCVHENSPNAEVTGTLSEGVDSISDPYADRQADMRTDITSGTSGSADSCDFSPGNNVTETIDPGYYDDCTFAGNGTIELNSGTYYIDSSLTIGGNVTITGSEVTIIMLEESDLDFGNNGTVTLTAPTSGTYEDIAIMGHPDMNSSKQAVFHNNIDLEITGALYFPNQTIEMSNGMSVSDGCVLLVSDFVYMHNNVDMDNNCDGVSDEKLSTGGTEISLVE